MDDTQIVALYWKRSETAIAETARQYGTYCHTIAYNILHDEEESEDCVNDAYMQAWDSIPPHRPTCFRTFIGKLTRHLALNRYKRRCAEKRGGGQTALVLDELAECIPDDNGVEQLIDAMALTQALNRFLSFLPAETRKVFMRRYWYFSPIKDIASDFSISESKVKMMLLRTRNELKKTLEKEGLI